MHVAFTSIDQHYSSKLHTHDFAELFLVSAGSGRHRLPHAEQQLSSGDLVFIAPEHCHGFAATQMDIINIAFEARILEQCQQLSPVLRHCFVRPQPRILTATAQQQQRLRYWAEELTPQRASVSGVQAMLLDLMREAELSTDEQPAPAWLESLLEAVAEPPLLTEGMSALVRLSRRSREYIWRMCRDSYGCSPQELLGELRMRWAERMLRLSDEPVARICLDCGYSNISHFYRMFKKSYGTTPARYRRQQHSAIT